MNIVIEINGKEHARKHWDAVPRAGERIMCNDGVMCEVVHVMWQSPRDAPLSREILVRLTCRKIKGTP